jgi:isoleucyl-tRNA synthetase
VKISPLKANMLENNQRIRWVPSHLQNGRFGKGIESAPDWNISRNRYWGTPIPVWVCGCGHKECVGGLSDLHRLVGSGSEAAGREIHHDTVRSVQETIHREAAGRLSECGIDRAWAERLERAQIPDNDIHRHIIDALPVTCPRCGEAMKRTPEVLDCWFESGSMPYAQIHYPFENSAAFDERFPADFIAEGLDQTRGWFYTLTVLASALFRKEAFKNVVVNGIILAEDGKKLSKRLKNYAPVEEILDKFGADALRLFLIDSPAVKAEDLRFSEAGVMEISRSALLPLWNAYTFFVTYATIDQWSPDRAEAGKSPNELDRWILSLLGSLVRAVEKEMEHYNLYRVVPLLVDYIDNLTNWYIRRSRRRFWKSENDEDKTHAYSTLHRVLVEFSKIMAPFLPFCTEAIYRNLCGTSIAAGRAERSVHLAAFPQAENVVVDEDLVEKMRLARAIVSMGRALRSRFSIKTRQPLRDMTVIIRDAGKRGLMLDMEPLVREELNVKEVRFSDDESAVVSLSAKANFKKLGKRLGPKMKEAAQRIESFSPKEIDLLEKGGTVDVLGEAIGQGDIEIRRTKREGVVVETQEDITVALNTEITRELEDECAAREFVNRVQNMRKKNDLKLTDRIAVRCACPGRLQEALRRFEEYIRSETLARSIDWGLDTKWGPAEEVEINDEPAQVQLTVVG